MDSGGNFDSEIPINLDIASVEEIVVCEHLRFNLNTDSSLRNIDLVTISPMDFFPKLRRLQKIFAKISWMQE